MRSGRFFWRRFVVVLGVLAAAAGLLVAVVHAPFVRAAALRYAVATVEDRYSLRLEAARLDYNLGMLRVGLANLRVSALHSPGEPFVTADYLSVVLPWRTLFGDVAIDDINVTNARVHVRRRENGTSNLPPASDTSAGEPSPLRIRRVSVPQLVVDLRDEQAARFLWVPSIALLLTPDEGYVRLGRDAELNTETQITTITRLNGDASFDGRALHVENLQVQSDEGSLVLDGSVTLIAREQAIDVRARGTIDATRVTRWVVTSGDLPRGDVTFEADTTGVFDRLDTRLSATSTRLAWQDLEATDLTARAHITADAADIEALRFGFWGGRVTAAATLPFDPAANRRVKASWTGIDAAAAVMTLAPGAPVVPSGSLSGELNADGMGAGAARWSGTARVAVAPGRNAPGRVAVNGNASLALRDGSWQLDGRHVVGGIAPLTLTLRGNVDNAVEGSMHVGETDLPGLLGVLRTTGVADIQSDAIAAGTLEGEVRVSGNLEDPAVEGRAVVRNATGSQVEAPLLQVDVSGRPLQPQLEFRVEVPEAVAADQPLRDIQTTGRFTDSLLVIDGLSASQPSTSGRLVVSGTYDVGTRRYTATLEGTQWVLNATTDQPVAASLDVRFMGEGTVEQPRGTGEVTVRDAMWRDIALGPLDASVELDGGVARIEAQAPEFATSASSRIELRSPYQTSLDARAQMLDLTRLLKGLETPATITGETTLRLQGELPLQAWRTGSATLDVNSLEARAGDLPVRVTGPARVRYDAERVHIDRLDLAAGEMAVSASGSLPVFDPAPDTPGVLLTVTGDVGEVVRTATALGLTQLPLTGGDGPVALLSRVTGTIQQPVVAADLEVGPASVAVKELPTVTGLVVRAHAEDGVVELREAAAEYEGAQLSATGKAPLSLFSDRLAAVAGPGASGPGTGQAVIHARATNLTPAVLTPFVEPGAVGDLTGSVDLSLDAATSTLELADLTGELRIDRFDLRVADVPVTQRVPTRIVARDGFARVDAWEWTGQGTSLT
ncbi:MAG: hypothetical protein ACRD3C_02815, partial [Vicinamibacterales bacterium]